MGSFFVMRVIGWVRRRKLGASGALNDCNRAKSPGIGRLQIRFVYFAPNAGIFYPIKTVYHTRRWFCTAGWCAADTFAMLRDKCYTVAESI